MEKNRGSKNGKRVGAKLPGQWSFWLQVVFLAVFTFAIYFATLKNFYNLDDRRIGRNDPLFEQGLGAIPELLTTLYADSEELSYGYRPLARVSYAIEHQFFRGNPYVSHFFNNLFYIIAVLLLFRVLRRLLKDYHPYLPFVIALLFAAHPIHTEVVASLKNRDEIFVLILGLWSLDLFISYAYNPLRKHLVAAIALFILAFFAKKTIGAFFWIIPLSLYFFTPMENRKNIRLTLVLLGTALIAAFVPFFFLPGTSRPLSLIENPLVADPSLVNRIAYAGFTLYYYLRLLIFPHPLLYYYGYNMFPDISPGNVLVIAGILVHAGLLAYAIWKFREKHILSFAILAYLTSIALFANLVNFAPGIIAERFLLMPSIGFCIALGYLLFRLFRLAKPQTRVPATGIAGLVIVTLVILAPYTGKTYTRNFDWRTEYSLMKADMPFLWDSFKGNDQYADAIMKNVNRELAKPVNVLKFIKPLVDEAILHQERASEICPIHPGPYNNLGMIYSRSLKNQDTAIVYFNKALACYPLQEHIRVDNDMLPMIYFNLGMAYESKFEFDRAIGYYRQSLDIDSMAVNPRSKLANAYYMTGNFRKAVELNQQIMQMNPGEPLPYVNIGNYYIFQKDTLNGIRYYEKAVELGAPADASIFLSKYFASRGDLQKANHYQRIANEIKKNQASE
jgi:tetratricopeptide (TPR) repeat protein